MYVARRVRDYVFLLYPARARHGKSYMEHRVCSYEFHSGIYVYAPLAAVRACIRSQRYCLDSLVVDTGGNRPQCDMYDSMLFRILAQRYLRLYQLAAHAPQTAKGQKRRVVSIIAKYMLR